MTQPPTTPVTPRAQTISSIDRTGREFLAHLFWAKTHKLAEISEVYDEKFIERISAKLDAVESDIKRQLRIVARIDAALLIVLATKLQNAEFLGFPLHDLSFALEALLLMASVAFFVAAIKFNTSFTYLAIIQNWCVVKDPFDSGYLQASFSEREAANRIMRPKAAAESFGDYFTPSASFEKTTFTIQSITLAVVMLVVFAHIAIQLVAVRSMLTSHTLGITVSCLIAAVVLSVIIATIAMAIVPWVRFTFTNYIDKSNVLHRKT